MECRSFFCSFWHTHLLSSAIVRSSLLILFVALLVFSAAMTRAEEFKLTNGETVTGEVLPTSANDQGVQVKVGEGQYQRVPWASFSQDDLKNFSKNQRMQPFVEPFIEPNPEAKVKKTEVNIKQPPRLERPAKQSLFGAFFSSGLGVFVMLLLYAATIYAAFEVAIFRARPPLLVCGLSAVPFLGILSPIIFLSLRTNVKSSAQPVESPAEAKPQPAAASEAEVNPMLAEGAAHPSGLKIAHTEVAKSTLPEPITYQRGQFTFNRRFFETKFPGFFGVVRREAEKDMVLVIKSSRGEYTTQRISRIAANDLHVQIQRGAVTEEIMVPFQEIKELCLKHKDA